MTVLVTLLGGTALAMLLLVLYGNYLFEENRTRVARGRDSRDHRSRTDRAVPTVDEVEWRTLVDPIEAANRARASKPFAAAYARAMVAAHEDGRAA